MLFPLEMWAESESLRKSLCVSTVFDVIENDESFEYIEGSKYVTNKTIANLLGVNVDKVKKVFGSHYAEFTKAGSKTLNRREFPKHKVQALAHGPRKFKGHLESSCQAISRGK